MGNALLIQFPPLCPSTAQPSREAHQCPLQ
jgi:hypothetical protein